MSFYRSKAFWITAVIVSSPLLITGYYGFKIITSVYKTGFGNGVIIYADDYVRTGKWVFDCDSSLLIRREPLLAPIAELEESGSLTISRMYSLNNANEEQAKVAIREITGIKNWYKKLIYRYSRLNENSDLRTHVFDLLARHDGRWWALNVWQRLDYHGGSTFEVTAYPYDPETYIDYAKALQAVAKSCPAPQ
ncbi:hypothetical protein ACCD10_21040 [Pseudomonas sp. Pseusp122]|uniref:hypothetical protein n=1 Tax=unclassified Pseudomonas TaxID=196821 RepID=UPI0039A5BF5A